MASREFDLSDKDCDTIYNFVRYLGSNTTWRTSFRENNRLERVAFWDLTRPNVDIEHTYIGVVIDLLNTPVEDLLIRKGYSLCWEQQVVNFKLQELE